jgi:hypothetical protein
VVSVTDPYGRILGFLDRTRYFSIKWLLSCTHETEWTPFQTHYFFFLVVPGIEPGLRHKSTIFYIKMHKYKREGRLLHKYLHPENVFIMESVTSRCSLLPLR